MINNTFPKHKFTVVADDVREEKNGKISLVGMYGDDMTLGVPFPCVLPKIAIFSRFFGGEGAFKFRLSVLDPIGTELVTEEQQNKVIARHGKTFNLVLNVSPFIIEKEGAYKIKIFFDNKLMCSDDFTIISKKQE